jgi:hypothetical protein
MVGTTDQINPPTAKFSWAFFIRPRDVIIRRHLPTY